MRTVIQTMWFRMQVGNSRANPTPATASSSSSAAGAVDDNDNDDDVDVDVDVGGGYAAGLVIISCWSCFWEPGMHRSEDK